MYIKNIDHIVYWSGDTDLYIMVLKNCMIDRYLKDFIEYKYRISMIKRMKTIWLINAYKPPSGIMVRKRLRELVDAGLVDEN